MSTIAERVAAGAAFLDKREPGWDRRIDLDRLDLESACACVLGQLHFDKNAPDLSYIYAIRKLQIQEPRDAEFGFDVLEGAEDFSAEEAEFEELTAEWKRVLTKRRTLVTA